MRFTPQTEQELQMASLLPEGAYQYQVIKSEDKVSKAGNEYTAITLKVWDSEGREHLVFTNMALIKLVKHFCDVNDMQAQYQSGNIPCHDFLNKCGGRVVLGIEGEKPNPNGGVYKAKNVVHDYIAAPASSATMPLAHNDLNDDLPF